MNHKLSFRLHIQLSRFRYTSELFLNWKFFCFSGRMWKPVKNLFWIELKLWEMTFIDTKC